MYGRVRRERVDSTLLSPTAHAAALACSTCLAWTVSACSLFVPIPDSGAGCKGDAATWYPAAAVVKQRATHDLDCPLGELTASAQGDTNVAVAGCGQSALYACEADAVSGCSLDEAANRDSCSRLR